MKPQAHTGSDMKVTAFWDVKLYGLVESVDISEQNAASFLHTSVLINTLTWCHIQEDTAVKVYLYGLSKEHGILISRMVTYESNCNVGCDEKIKW